MHSTFSVNGNEGEFSSFVHKMNDILHIDQPDLANYILSVLSLDDEKQRILRFRKLLERAKKENCEKGVPNHVQPVFSV